MKNMIFIAQYATEESIISSTAQVGYSADGHSPSLWPSGIGMHLGRNRLRVRVLAVSDTYPMFIEPTITQVPSGFSGYIWLDTKIVLKNIVSNCMGRKSHLYMLYKPYF